MAHYWHSHPDSSPAVPVRHESQGSTRRFDRRTWILAPSPVFSRGIQHLVEHSQQTDREAQSKSSLVFCSGWLFQPLKPSPSACPYLDEGSADLHSCLGFTWSSWERVYHLGGVMLFAAIWSWNIKPTGTQEVKNKVCARCKPTGADCLGLFSLE